MRFDEAHTSIAETSEQEPIQQLALHKHHFIEFNDDKDRLRSLINVDSQEGMYNPVVHRGLLDATEKWTSIRYHHGIVASVNKESVLCSILTDEENNILADFAFPTGVMSHIPGLQKGTYVTITVKEKPGSKRFDIAYRKEFELTKAVKDSFSLHQFSKQLDDIGDSVFNK